MKCCGIIDQAYEIRKYGLCVYDFDNRKCRIAVNVDNDRECSMDNVETNINGVIEEYADWHVTGKRR